MAEQELVRRLEKAALETKLRLLDLCHQTLIHIGGDLSVCDMMTAIWQYAMRYDVKDPHWEGRDRFVLSKGHAAAVTSFSQAAIGCYDVEDIYKEYATDFGRFGMHSCNLANPYVDVSTGSLGHGLPVAGGAKAAAELGIPENTMYAWTKAAREGRLDIGSGSHTPQTAMNLAEELALLRRQVKEQEKEIRRLKEENEFLEEASAFFAASRRKSAKGRE